MPVIFHECEIPGVVAIETELHVDGRGAFGRVFCVDEFVAQGLPTEFPQCNISINPKAGTLRGMHYNVEPFGEAKLVRCVRGEIYDVVVDLRPASPTRWQHVAFNLSAENCRALFVPAGFAHGFLTLQDDTDVYYHMSRRYVPSAARGLRWNDPALAIEWPCQPTILSAGDAGYADVDMPTFDLAD